MIEVTYNEFVKNCDRPNVLTSYENFKQIEKVFGKKNCIRFGKGKMLVLKENAILLYDRRFVKMILFEKKKRRGDRKKTHGKSNSRS